MTVDPIQFYQDQSASLSSELEKLDGTCRVLSIGRGICFLLVGGLFFAAFFSFQGLATLWWTLFGIAAVAFLSVVVVHHFFEENRNRKQAWLDFYKQGLARIRRDWEQMGNPKKWVQSEKYLQADDQFVAVGMTERSVSQLDLATVNDLDLEGEKSLWRLINLARTQFGQETLSRWMLEPGEREAIEDRQATIQKFSEDNEWRHHFLMACRDVVRPDSSPSEIVRWAVGEKPPAWLRALIRVAQLNTALFLLIGVLGLVGVLSAEKTGTGLLVLVAINFLISVATAGTVHEIFRRVGAKTRDVVQYEALLRQVENSPATDGTVDRLKQELFGDGQQSDCSYATGMRRLVAYSQLSGLRNGMTFLVYVVLQFCCLWDLHVLERLESWRQNWGVRVPKWFYVLGNFEALAALAQFRFEHPQWNFPRIVDASSENGDYLIQGNEVGHPLLGEVSVRNPVSVGQQEKTLLVTGSNMSGKSTYLRTLGVNLILARMGSVVFAKSFQTPAVEIGTSMRVADSLSDGISFFMSELQRLKQVVDRAKECSGGPSVFVYLLDEILQGTNSQERQIAVTRVIQQLLKHQAIGALSTHDLQLPEVKDLDGKLDIVHFKEDFQQVDGKEQMTFDYLMRPGMTPTTNALKLLALVGLDEA